MANMFEEHEKTKAMQAAKNEAAVAQRKAELGQVARKVADDLTQYIGTHPNIYGQTIDVGINSNRITLRKKTSSEQIEITALSRESFQFSVNGAPAQDAAQGAMIEAVLRWIKTGG